MYLELIVSTLSMFLSVLLTFYMIKECFRKLNFQLNSHCLSQSGLGAVEVRSLALGERNLEVVAAETAKNPTPFCPSIDCDGVLHSW